MISGLLLVSADRAWNLVEYVQYKDVLKICSFFYFNYGTISLDINENEASIAEQAFKSIETIDCPSNASHPRDCRIEEAKYYE